MEQEDTRNWNDGKLISYVKDAEVLVLANRPISRKVIENAPYLKLIVVAFTGLDKEPPLDPSHPFLGMAHVILTPHIGYRTKEATACKVDLVIAHIKNELDA